jgi:hypothetical protein
MHHNYYTVKEGSANLVTAANLAANQGVDPVQRLLSGIEVAIDLEGTCVGFLGALQVSLCG